MDMTKEDLLKLLDRSYIYIALHSCEYGDVKDFFIVTLDIEKVTSTGIQVKDNEYDIGTVPLSGFKEYWAFTKEELE